MLHLTTDYHCHLLSGLDDGPDSLNESLEMARLLVATGFKEVHCTPHYLKGMYETTPEQVLSGITELQAALDRAAIPLKLHPGMEYSLDEFFPAELNRLLPLGDTRLVLVEVPFQAIPQQIKENIFQLCRRRFIPLIAHPERTPLFRAGSAPGIIGRLKHYLPGQPPLPLAAARNPLTDQLKEMGCLFQGNLGSFAGLYGAGVQRQAEALRQAGLYHCYGTDAHRAEQIAEGIARWVRVAQVKPPA